MSAQTPYQNDLLDDAEVGGTPSNMAINTQPQPDAERQQMVNDVLQNYSKQIADTGSPLGSPIEKGGQTRSPSTVYFELDQANLETLNSAATTPTAAAPVAANSRSNVADNDGGGEDNEDLFSMVSTVITADGIADPTSFKINLFLIFLGDMARGIFFPTMWNLVTTIGFDQVLLGYVIASFSFGRILVLPLFGTWSTTYGFRWTMMLSTSILLLGTVLQANVLNVNKAWFLILANTIMGIGSGTLGVTLAYVSEVTPKRKRTGYIAWATACQYAGTTATPFLGSLFIVLFPEDEYYGEVGFPSINEFTAPAYFMFACSALAIYLLYAHFEDRPRMVMPPVKKSKKKSDRQKSYDEVANARTCCGFFSVYSICLYGCMFLNAITKGPMSCFETLGIEFAESRFNMYRAQAGSIVATMGLIGACNLMAMGWLSQRFTDTQLTCSGVILFMIGILMNTNLDQDDPDNNADWRYVLSMFFSYSIGYPICHTALIGLFSKIVGRKPQGALQGWFSSSGSVARIACPVLAGYITRNQSIEVVFFTIAGLLGVALLFLTFFRNALTKLSS